MEAEKPDLPGDRSANDRVSNPEDKSKIPKPKSTTQIRHLANSVNGFDYSFSWMQGRRPTMEDEHIIEHINLDVDVLKRTSLFGVLDGHGGSAVAIEKLRNFFLIHH